MTWATYWWGVFGGAGAIMLVSYLVMKALWPILQKHRWVIGDWEE